MFNFKIKKNIFLKSILITQGATEKKISLPVLSNLLIESIDLNKENLYSDINSDNKNKGLIKISATDLEITIKDYCGAEIISEGKITLNAKKLYSIIKEFPDDKTTDNNKENKNEDIDIEIKETEAGLVIISYKKIIFKLTTIPVIDYPTLLDINNDDNFNVNLKFIKFIINKVIFSTALEETKKSLSGVYFILLEIEGENYLRLVATDGHRLSLAQIKLFNNNENKIEKISKDILNKESSEQNNSIYDKFKEGVIIPRKILSELIKIDVDKDVFVNIAINSNNVIFKLNDGINNKNNINYIYGTTFISRLIDGKYPNYETILPKNNYKTAIIKTEELINSIKRVYILAEEKSHSIELSFDKNLLIIKTVQTSQGEAVDEIGIEYSGEPINIKLNSKYILDFISNIYNEKIILKFNTIFTPLIIEPLIEDNNKKKSKSSIDLNTFDYQLTGVFMPMRY
ncbi:MAG: DNA polymerase III subunit beta [Candidatus Acididesulfobacter diazotrophicus]|jgi:DNA polymerase-3 subunit beta|uniref:DNA polymerase III subunit beta n=1 Tax=Candidatus Acididesulfobacter diazotrophicus TaxID=2597226 RepID=A0A519BQ72_9DELT|nr:MAG: DNA polymerase III subunit beta [Candidatus Acididesulfobacter diazotrophicus]